MDQAVKFIEDMQEDFDFRYKTLQSRGEQSEISEKKNPASVVSCVFVRLRRSERRLHKTGSDETAGHAQQTGLQEEGGHGCHRATQEVINSIRDLLSSHSRQEILSKMDVAVKEIEDLMTSQLSPELQDWKRRQQIAAIGGPLLTGLDQLQNWYSDH